MKSLNLKTVIEVDGSKAKNETEVEIRALKKVTAFKEMINITIIESEG